MKNNEELNQIGCSIRPFEDNYCSDCGSKFEWSDSNN
jgi:hypothetical protein